LETNLQDLNTSVRKHRKSRNLQALLKPILQVAGRNVAETSHPQHPQVNFMIIGLGRPVLNLSSTQSVWSNFLLTRGTRKLFKTSDLVVLLSASMVATIFA
jgi:hypothetical protein